MKTQTNIALLNPLIEGVHKSEDLERAILGVVMIDRDAILKILHVLKAEMFYSEFNQHLYRVMIQLFNEGQGIDMMTITLEMLKLKEQNFKYANVSYDVAMMTRDVVSSAHILQWAYKLVELWQNRETFYIQNGYYHGETPEETRDMIADKLFQMAVKKQSDWVDASFVANALLAHIEEVNKVGETGIKLGIGCIDKTLRGGAKPGQLIVIGARPGVGKSAIINLWATQAAKQGKTVGLINLEMKDINSFARMVSMESDIEYWRIIDGKTKGDEEQKRMMDYLVNMANFTVWFSSSTDVNITDIRGKAYQLHKRANLGILFIDYLQLIEGMGGKNTNREQQVAQMSRGCKLIARELDIPVVLLAQLNRESTKTGDKRPQATHLRESGAIEQDADVIILLHRDLDDDGEAETGKENEAFASIPKHRDGKRMGWLPIGFDGTKMKFYDLEPPAQNYTEPNQSPAQITRNMIPPHIMPPNSDLPF